MSRNLILKNACYLFTSNILVRLINAASGILVARYLRVEEYGSLSIALAISAVAGYFTDQGLSYTLVREGTKPEANLSELLSSYFRVRMLFALVTALVTILAVQNLYKEPYLQKVVYLVVMPTILGASLSGLAITYFQIIQQMSYIAVMTGTCSIVNAGLLYWGVFSNWSLITIALVYGFSNLFSGIIGVWLVARRTPFYRGWNGAILNGLGYFSLGGIVIMLLPQLGPLVLERVVGMQQVGYFSAAYRIPGMLYQIPAVLGPAFFPMLFRYGNISDLNQHLRLCIIELKLMNAVGILMALPFFFYAQWWTKTLFGAKWLPASDVLSMLSLLVILQSINYPLATALTTKGMQDRRAKVLFWTLPLAVVSYGIFGKWWGSYGGGLAAIFAEALLTVGFILANPTGRTLAWEGTKYNCTSFLIVTVGGKLFITKLTALIGMPVIMIAYTGILLMLDEELRDQAIQTIASYKRYFVRDKYNLSN